MATARPVSVGRGRLAGNPRAWLAAAVIVAAAAAWFAGGAVTRLVQAARVPPLPDLSTMAAPVRDALVAAHASALQAPSAATVGALGEAYHANLRADDALAAYARAERMAPDTPAWTYRRALLLEERGDQPGTRSALERVVSLDPGAGLAWYRLAELAFKQGRLNDAVNAYEKARDAPGQPPFLPAGVGTREVVPISAYASAGLARVAQERGDRDSAGRALAAVRARHPRFGTPFVPPSDPVLDAIVAQSRQSDQLLKYAGVATRGGDQAWREYLVRRAMQFNPRDLNVLMELAGLLQATARYDEALKVLAQHEALAPGDHHTLVERGRTLSDLGRLDEAEAVLRRAVVVRDAAAEYNLATVLDRQQRWDEARAHYERALVIDPFHTRAMNNLGVGLDQRGDSAAALRLLARAIEIAPDSAEFYVNYGSALIRQRRYDEAVAVLTDGIALDPRAASAHNNLGIALAQRGDLARARDAFAQALALDPRHADAGRNLAQVTGALAARN